MRSNSLALATVTAALTATVSAAAATGTASAVRSETPAQGTGTTRAYADTLAEVVGRDAVRVDRLTDIAATAPRRVQAGTRVVVSGVVKVRAGSDARRRPVRLAELTPSGWTVRASSRSTRRGVFELRVPAGAATGTRVLQVRAPRRNGLAATRSDRLVVRVVAPVGGGQETPAPPAPPATDPAYDSMLGAADDWTYLFTGGARWNPCTTIEWAYNPAGGYAGSLADVQEAFDRLAARTGLTFSYVGATTYVPWTGGTFPAGTDIALGWADATQVPSLSGSTVGVGGGSTSSTRAGADVPAKIVRGQVVFDKGDLPRLRQGYDVSGSGTWGQVFVHEVMHTLGLGHAEGAEQVMYPSITATNHRFGAGDLTGLGRVGASAGCLS